MSNNGLRMVWIITFFTVNLQRPAFNTDALMCAGHKTTLRFKQQGAEQLTVCLYDAVLG